MRAALFALGLVLGVRAGWEFARWVIRALTRWAAMPEPTFYQCCSCCVHGFQMPEHQHAIPCPRYRCLEGRKTAAAQGALTP
jgi:hypothetical protein